MYLLSIEDVEGVQVLQGEEDVSRVELGSVLLEAANLAEVEEELAAFTQPIVNIRIF